MSYQWDNGIWLPSPGIPLTDRGFRHGMSAFETLAIHRGRFVFLTQHLEKLRVSCASLGLREPPDLASFSFLTDQMDSFTIARLYVTAGDGTFRTPLDQGRIFLTCATTPASSQASQASEASGSLPRSLSIASQVHHSVWPGLKTGNYWPNITAYRHAADLQSDEMVLVNSDNHVLSASLANLFAVIDGELLTPRTARGARAGVLRDWVLANEEVIITDFHPGQLREAGEIFLTSSGYGIAPIATLEGKPLASRQRGERLRAIYLDWLENAPSPGVATDL